MYPTSDITAHQNRICEILFKLENSKTRYIINGDININLLNTSTTKIINYTDILTSVGCNFIIQSPTRFFNNSKPSLLDHFYTNISDLHKIGGICLYDISDHLLTFLKIDNLQPSRIKKDIYRRSMKNFNIEYFLIDVQEQPETLKCLTLILVLIMI